MPVQRLHSTTIRNRHRSHQERHRRTHQHHNSTASAVRSGQLRVAGLVTIKRDPTLTGRASYHGQEATTVTNMLSLDCRSSNELRTRLETDLADVQQAIAIIDGYKNPQGETAAKAKAAAGFPLEYFLRKYSEFGQRLERYKSSMEVSSSLDSTCSLCVVGAS